MDVRRRGAVAAVVAAVAALALAPSLARAHVERTSYWPDPAPDTSVHPAAGGAVPKARSLTSALSARARGTTRVVCQSDSLKRATSEIASARRDGWRDRPTESLRHLSAAGARRLLSINRRMFARCAYDEIQPAVTASHNDDRVVIMPGVYTEPESRRVPAFPKKCDQYRTTSDHGSGAVSYAYQYHCPNAQALIAVIGRALGPGQDPPTSPTGRPDPHGIPNLGRCIRCNVQIEGSGPAPSDTIVDAGRVASGDHGPLGSKKDVGLKADRADGIVIRNMTVRHAAEHDVYVLETDGYLLNRMRFFYAGEYGALMFTSDHGLTDVCEGVGNGDSAVYPGGAPDTGTRRDTRFYPTLRLNQTITHCDLHHNNLGYSGTMGNATHVIDNNFYGNTTGIATDSFFAGGHPGYPQDSAVFEHNRIYSNNFDVYGPKSDVVSSVPVPIGVGILIAGGDDDTINNNYIYDNWRRGTMLIAVPDAVSCAPNPDEGAPPCTPQGAATTSTGDRYFGNVMSRTPGGKVMPNGVDFWWDEFPTNNGDCWYSNTGWDGSSGSVTSDPARAPVANTSIPGFLPEACDAPTNVGIGDPAKESVLLGCVADFAQGTYDATVCDWFAMPPKPPKPKPASGSPLPGVPGVPSVPGAPGVPIQVPPGVSVPGVPGGGAGAVPAQAQQEPFPTLPGLCSLLGGIGGTLTCLPFAHRLS